MSAPRLALHHAATEAAETRSWQCAWCDLFLEDHETEFCRRCAEYRADVADGIFNDRWEDARVR